MTCACYFEQPNPENAAQTQGFCRRLPADMTAVRGLEPRIDRQGNPVLKDGQPVMQPAQIIGYLFKTTRREGTCFDGWRPQGTLPGETVVQTTLRQVRPHLEPLLTQVRPDIRPFVASLFGLDPVETPTSGQQN